MVPNVPCGVESPSGGIIEVGGFGFLMYRVELKDLSVSVGALKLKGS